jgi:dienelactone hydrolase
MQRLMRKRIIRLWWVLTLTCLNVSAAEQVWQLPIPAMGEHSSEFAYSMGVLENTPNHSQPAPFVVILHGRPAKADEFMRMGRVEYPALTRYLLQKGYAVITPTRIGYGISMGPDLEATDSCRRPHYAKTLAAPLLELQLLWESLQKRPEIDHNKGIIIGHSFGGLLAIAATTQPLHGLQGVINFAGGDGGDTVEHPDQPCSAALLAHYFTELGHGAKPIPSLWLYSTNDHFWGTVWPHRWFLAYQAQQPLATWQELPADKNNGHYLMTRNQPLWEPSVEVFLAHIQR